MTPAARHGTRRSLTLRFVRQRRRGECGLCCLAMVLRSQGVKTAMRELRALASHTGNPVSAATLVDIASRFGVRMVGVSGSLRAIAKLDRPAILHLENYRVGHYIVLAAADQLFTVADPLVGWCILTSDQLDNRYSGVALVLADRGGRARQIQRRSA